MQKIKSFIIGLGNIGIGYDKTIKNKYFYTHAKSITYSKIFDLVGGSDISKKKRDIFLKKYKKPVFHSIDLPLLKTKPSLVVLSTPTNTHFQCIKKIVKHKCVKFLICEKPLSTNINEAEKIVKICKKNNIKLFVNYFRISEPSTQKLKKIFINNKNEVFGKVYYSRGFFNNASHFLNLFEYIFGEFKNGYLTKRLKIFRKYDLKCNFFVELGDAKINFICKNKEFDQFKFELKYGKHLIKYTKNGEQIVIIKKGVSKNIINNLMYKYQLNVYNEITKYILKKKNYHLCSGDDALKTVNNMYKILNHEKI
tara:strand:- start:240 stop:1169 length:930 start_codon:yes stop_codon:yes gene_type:complete